MIGASARVGLLIVIGVMFMSATAAAQIRPAPRPIVRDSLSVRGFANVGGMLFTADESFKAVLGTRTGPLFGGGGELVLPQRIFASFRISRFQQDGERAFVFEGETFGLGIETTVRVMPIEVTGGYRFAGGRSRVVPYLGGGLGWHRYKETSAFADAAENVDETHQGYHVVGGAEFRAARWLGLAGEWQWTTVPDALGQDPNGVSTAFGETDLGGMSVTIKFVIGR